MYSSEFATFNTVYDYDKFECFDTSWKLDNCELVDIGSKLLKDPETQVQ